MYMVDHPAWGAPPGVLIELPPLNTAVLDRAGAGSIFQVIAEDEVARLRTLSECYPDDALIGLARVAAAAFADVRAAISDRRSAIRYLAVNTSAKLEDYWATDDRLWHEAGDRIVELSDVVAEQKEQILRDKAAITQRTVTEADLALLHRGPDQTLRIQSRQVSTLREDETYASLWLLSGTNRALD